MRSLKPSGITALTAAIALSLGAIPLAVMAPSLLAGGPSLTIAPAAPAGTLTLATSPSQGTVTWNGKSQAFTGGQQCKITPTPGSSDLLAITGSVGSAQGSAGFREGSIGVFELTGNNLPPANASQCFRVDADSFTTTETLTLSLGGVFKDTLTVATTATVSLQAKSQSGTVEATMLRAGAPTNLPDVVTKWTRQSGDAIVLPALPVGEFTGIALKATAGSFSLVGATFTLGSKADAVLDCAHPSISKGSTTATFVGNAGSAVCTGGGFGVTLTTGPNTLELLKPATAGAEAQFVIDYEWEDNANTGTTGELVPRTKADFDGDGTADDPTALFWCPDLVNHTVNGQTVLVVNNVATNPKATDLAPNYAVGGNTKQFACIESETPTLVPGTNRLKVKQRVYVYGDIRLAR